jgi:hypothetical protein
VSDAHPALLQRQPSWAENDMRPHEGAWCRACYGIRWWTELHAPKGWRCMNCHPPVHLAPERVEIVGGVSR